MKDFVNSYIGFCYANSFENAYIIVDWCSIMYKTQNFNSEFIFNLVREDSIIIIAIYDRMIVWSYDWETFSSYTWNITLSNIINNDII